MRKHSIESKTRIGQRWSNPCQQNQQTISQFFKQKPDHRGNLRRCESASSLNRKGNNEFYQMEQKYKLLQQEYMRLNEAFKEKKFVFDKQRREIQRLSKQTIKQENQIKRLKQMLKMTKKKDIGLQTDPDSQKSTWRKRMQLSNGQSDITSETRCQELPSAVRKSSKAKKLNNGQKKNNKVNLSKISKYSKYNEDNSQIVNSPLNKKYKFVPTLAFKHI